MAAASSPTFVQCPGCGERLGVRAADAGKKARCGKCGLVFVVATPSATDGGPREQAKTPAVEPSAPRPPLDDEGPATVTFACSLCDTRITAATRNVGKKVKCPDCGRVNVIPPPPKAKKPVMPAAMEGEQIELAAYDPRSWGEQESETPAAPLHPVECKLCGTLMYARHEQIGRTLKCPDCGALTVAQRSAPKKKPVLPELVGKEYELDPESKPTKRYVPVPIAVRDAELHAHARATTVGPDGRLIVQRPEEYKRPVMPRNPLLSGVWRMLLTSEVVARWLMMSVLFGIAAWIIVSALITPLQSVGSIAEIFILLGGIGVAVVWLTFAAPTFLTIVGESAEGHDRFHDAPDWSPLEWMGECLQFATPIGIAGLLGAAFSWGIAAIASAAGVTPPREVVAALAAMGPLAFFPLAFLGTLLEDSMFAVVSPRAWSTLAKCPGPWLLFYAESALLIAAASAAGWSLLRAAPTGLFALPFLLMGVAVIYMRLLGRLAWWISEATAVDDDEEFHDEAAAAHPHLAAARREAHERRQRGEAD